MAESHTEIRLLPATEIVDGDAVAIGELYERSNSSFAGALQARLDCGRMLAKKKSNDGTWWMASLAQCQLGYFGV